MQRRWPLVLIGAVIATAVVFTIMSSFYVDVLWYREVELSSVFWKVIRTQFILGFAGAAFFFALLYSNVLIARRLAPTTRIIAPDQEVVERFRLGVEPYLWWLIPVGVGVLALFTGIGVSRQWQSFLLWQNSSGLTFDTVDPQFGRDPAYYVFTLPVLRFIQGLLFSSLVTVTILTAGAHVLWGGIRPQAAALADKVAPAVRAHLSLLLAAILLAKAWGYYLGRFTLVTSERGVVEGASYTDVKAQLPALTFLAVAAVVCAVLFLVNIRLRNWALPVIAVVILGGVSVLIGTAYPAFVQQFSVKPQEQQREEPYIEYNIEGTRAAFGLDTVTASSRPVTTTLTTDDLDENEATVSNIRLWRPQILLEDFQSLQRIKQYYEFEDVDVDRYQISGQQRVLMFSGREVAQDQIPQGGGTWQNAHLVYTHGYGAVASQVNTATAEGQPEFTLRDIPPVGQPELAQPRIYYGESDKVPFVLVGTTTDELDYEGAPDPQEYQGAGGISIGNIFQRALFAWRFRDVNLLISGQITADSKILIRRDLESRITTAAPFLHFDRDPYLAVVEGKLVWILDAYTTTDQYPYSQAVDASDVISGAGSINYIRNSVKVTVDAYDGTIKYIIVDPEDPIIQAWSNAFPEMFTQGSDASADLQAHYRYPEGLFSIQAFQYSNYHVTDPQVFYRKTDRWEVPADPTFCANNPTNAACGDQGTGSIPTMSPSYVLMRVPGEEEEQFVLIIPFVPQGRQNMVGWMAAKSDPGSYGEVVAYEFPQGVPIDGPSLAFSRMNQDRTFSSERSLLAQQGSDVLFGDFLVIPINDSFLYVQPVYVRSVGANAIPELKRVLVLNGQASGVGLADTLADALGAAVGGEPDGPTEPPTGTVEQQIQELLTQALDHFSAANEALKDGNLALYQSELSQAQALVQQANDLAEQAAGGGTGTGTSPSPTVSPTASPSP
ncbi:MAG TPA: UPF0182 family protein [Actinomycetota bacterium]|nr:UPF0182 family protein [Actinomycetota bacterium]